MSLPADTALAPLPRARSTASNGLIGQVPGAAAASASSHSGLLRLDRSMPLQFDAPPARPIATDCRPRAASRRQHLRSYRPRSHGDVHVVLVN